LKSAATIDIGLIPVDVTDGPGEKFPCPSFSNVEIVWRFDVPVIAVKTATSALPFPKKFPTATASTAEDCGISVGNAKVPFPLLKKMPIT
jgi:hypothetical protein